MPRVESLTKEAEARNESCFGYNCTIRTYLPRVVDLLVYKMFHKDPGNVFYSETGRQLEQIQELRDKIELLLTNPELFQHVEE